jgi:hypothetical protein
MEWLGKEREQVRMVSDRKYELIKKLEEEGVLGSELCPEPHYWHWPVLKPELLPESLKQDIADYGEIRLY